MSDDSPEPLKYITTPVRLEYDHSAGDAATGFLRGSRSGEERHKRNRSRIDGAWQPVHASTVA